MVQKRYYIGADAFDGKGFQRMQIIQKYKKDDLSSLKAIEKNRHFLSGNFNFAKYNISFSNSTRTKKASRYLTCFLSYQ